MKFVEAKDGHHHEAIEILCCSSDIIGSKQHIIKRSTAEVMSDLRSQDTRKIVLSPMATQSGVPVHTLTNAIEAE